MNSRAPRDWSRPLRGKGYQVNIHPAEGTTEPGQGNRLTTNFSKMIPLASGEMAHWLRAFGVAVGDVCPPSECWEPGSSGGVKNEGSSREKRLLITAFKSHLRKPVGQIQSQKAGFGGDRSVRTLLPPAFPWSRLHIITLGSNTNPWSGVVEQPCNPSVRRPKQQDCHVAGASLGSIRSSRSAWTTWHTHGPLPANAGAVASRTRTTGLLVQYYTATCGQRD